MSDMVERVARAIAAEAADWSPEECDANWGYFSEPARAAIEAMRDAPTDAMFEEAGAGYEELYHEEEYRGMWERVIDQGLGR